MHIEDMNFLKGVLLAKECQKGIHKGFEQLNFLVVSKFIFVGSWSFFQKSYHGEKSSEIWPVEQTK